MSILEHLENGFGCWSPKPPEPTTIPFEEAFPLEKHFHKLLLENMPIRDYLGTIIGLDNILEYKPTHEYTCDWNNQRVDIKLENSKGQRYLIEAQIDKSDDRHFHNVLMYQQEIDNVEELIWIAKDFRPEHVQFFNEHFNTFKVHLVKPTFYEDGNIKFEKVIDVYRKPRLVSKQPSDLSEVKQRYYQFWNKFDQQNFEIQGIPHGVLVPNKTDSVDTLSRNYREASWNSHKWSYTLNDTDGKIRVGLYHTDKSRPSCHIIKLKPYIDEITKKLKDEGFESAYFRLDDQSINGAELRAYWEEDRAVSNDSMRMATMINRMQTLYLVLKPYMNLTNWS